MAEKIFFSKTFFIFQKMSTLQKLKFLKNPDFVFHEIQNLSTQRPIFSAPRRSASSLDLFGQGEQFRQNVCIFWRKDGLNQKMYRELSGSGFCQYPDPPSENRQARFY